MEKLGISVRVIKDLILRNNPAPVKSSVAEAAEALDSLLNTHKCAMQGGIEIRKRLKSHLVSRKMEIFWRHRSASLGESRKTLSNGKKREAPSPLEEQIAKKGKGSTSPSYSEATISQAPKKLGNDNWLRRKNAREKRCARCTRGKGKKPKCSLSARSRDAFRLSAKNGQSYAEILKLMKAKVKHLNAGLEVMTIRRKQGEVGFYPAQELSSHGCFNAYLNLPGTMRCATSRDAALKRKS